MNISELTGKKILIAGYGKEGRSSERYLRAHGKGVTIGIADKTDGPKYLDRQNDYDILVKSPGIPKELIHIPYTTAVNLFFANVPGMKIGVTGTKGKSTTSTLIYEFLRKSGKNVHLVGNIGIPWLDGISPENAVDDIYVCELSSYQLDDIAYSPHISVFVSFFPEHMDYHGSVNAYWKAKSNIVRHAGEADYFVYNPAFPQLQQLAKESKAKDIPYISDLPFAVPATKLLGVHNQDNIRAAVTVGGILHVPDTVMSEVIRSFEPLPHRLQNIGTFKHITFYDDAISTTPESTMCAIDSLSGISVLFLGGQDRGYDFSKLAQLIHEKNIRNIVLFPDTGQRIEQLLSAYTTDTYDFCKTRDMKEAVQFAFDHAEPDTICLLSAASPSYSIWKNFEEKGELFSRFVRELGGNNG